MVERRPIWSAIRPDMMMVIVQMSTIALAAALIGLFALGSIIAPLLFGDSMPGQTIFLVGDQARHDDGHRADDGAGELHHQELADRAAGEPP
jgi:hypothetical protein